MSNPENPAPTCFNCGATEIKVEQLDDTLRYTCTRCGEEWVLEAPLPPGASAKKRRPKRYIANNRKQALGAAAVAAFVTLLCPVISVADGEICEGFPLSFPYILWRIAMFLPVALIAAGLAAVVSRRVPEIAAWIILGVCLAALALLNLFIVIGPAGC